MGENQRYESRIIVHTLPIVVGDMEPGEYQKQEEDMNGYGVVRANDTIIHLSLKPQFLLLEPFLQ